MKNRLKEPRKKNGKFWCKHEWVIVGNVGPDWDLRVGVKILCRCPLCNKLKYRRNTSVKEIPDELIDINIRYF